MRTVTIPKQEYEKLKSDAVRLKLIDVVIHWDSLSEGIMYIQEKQKSLDFLKNKEEDIYNLSDSKEIWKKEQ